MQDDHTSQLWNVGGTVFFVVLLVLFGAGTVAAAPTVPSTSGDSVEPGEEAAIGATINSTQNVTAKFPANWTATNQSSNPAAGNVSTQTDKIVWMYNSNQSSVDVTVNLAVPADTTPGQYTVYIVGEDGSGAAVNESVNVTVESPNTAPDGSFSVTPTEPVINETVTLNASNSSDPDGSIANYAWDFDGDGQYDDASGETATTSFNSAGEKTIALRVTDNESATDTTTRNVSVQKPAEFNVSNFSAPSSTLVGRNITVNATVTNTGDTTGSSQVEYVFDGTAVATRNVTLDAGNSTKVEFSPSTVGISGGNYTHGVRASNFSTAQITIREFVDVVGVDASGFSTIRAFVNVNTTDGRNGNLTAANFTVSENGAVQNVDSVQFTQSGNRTNLDIVYVFDRTGSMRDEIDDLRNQAKNVSRDLNQSGRDVRFALVTYSDNDIRANQNFTRNVTKLEASLDNVTTGGGTELAYDAIDKGLEQRFRGDAQKVLITVTDEEVNRDSDSPNITQVSTQLQQNGVNFVAISPPRDQLSSRDPELDLRELANRSGGVWYDIAGADFTTIIDDITGRLSTTYIVTYDTSNQVQGSTARTVNVTVEDPSGARDSARGQYIPPQVDITDVNTTDFPSVNATVNVNTTEARNGNLTADNFTISEDNAQRSIESFQFDSQNEVYVIGYTTPDPAENGTVRDVELVVNLSSGSTVVVTEDYQAPGTPSNQLPNVTFSASPTNPDVGETVTFDASNSTDPDGTIVSYEWDLDGDGNYDDATGVTVNTSYSSSGNRQVSLRVEDDGGATNTTSEVISVGDTQTVDSGGQPGFGAAIAVMALLAAALLARRQL